MYYEYANKKASDIVNLRRDLFGEIIEIVTDENQHASDSESDTETTDSEEIDDNETEDSLIS